MDGSMMKRLSTWINRKSTNKIAAATLLVMVLFMVLILPAQAEKSLQDIGVEESPDMSFFYGADDLNRLAEEYGESGRKSYIRTRWTFDLVFPLIYVSFLTTGIAWLSQQVQKFPDQLWFINLLPIASGLFDYLENIGASLVMAAFPAKIKWIAFLTPLFSLTKWSLISLSFLVYFGLIFVVLIFQASKMLRK
jgi:hypothetical protein